jgi:hypothetical protein
MTFAGGAGAQPNGLGNGFASLSVAVSGSPTAGVSFNVTVTALDNDADPDGGTGTVGPRCVTFSGAANSPLPLGKQPSYPLPGSGVGSCPGNESLLNFIAGQATASVTLFDAGKTSLTVTDAATGRSGTSSSFMVNAAGLDHFTLSGPASVVAGAQFAETLSAFDQWDNAASGWTSTSNCVVFWGPSIAPDGVSTPKYPSGLPSCGAGQSLLAFNGSGQATASPITLYDAQSSTTLTVKDTSGAHKGSTSVTVNPATLNPSFTTGPAADAQVSTPIYSDNVAKTPVGVTVQDAYDNPAPDGTQVTIPSQPGLVGAQAGTLGGVATFGGLEATIIGTYQLQAQVAPAQSAFSNPFQVVTHLTICNGTSCSTSVSNAAETANTSVTPGGSPFANLLLTDTLTGLAPPANVCNGVAPLPGTLGDEVEVVGGNVTSSEPSITIEFIIPQAELRAAGLNDAEADIQSVNICLGAASFVAGTPPWLDNAGNPAVFDPVTGLYWGVVPNASSTLPATNPYIASRRKDTAGNLHIILVKPYPWDGWAWCL